MGITYVLVVMFTAYPGVWTSEWNSKEACEKAMAYVKETKGHVTAACLSKYHGTTQ